MLGRRKLELWLLSMRVNSELVFLFSMTSPPAMMTGAILALKKGSSEPPLKLPCEDIVPGITRVVLETLLVLRRPKPKRP